MADDGFPLHDFLRHRPGRGSDRRASRDRRKASTQLETRAAVTLNSWRNLLKEDWDALRRIRKHGLIDEVV